MNGLKKLAELTEDTRGVYIMSLRCMNCNDQRDHKIPKGVKLLDYARGTNCDNCGCKLTQIS